MSKPIEAIRWSYCPHCREMTITCDKCGNSSCNGGGCEECREDFDTASRMILYGTAPPLPENAEELSRAYSERLDRLFGKTK